MPNESIAIIGASKDRNKYGNKAVRAYLTRGFTVYPINPREDDIEGLKVYRSILDIPGPVDKVSLYVPPEIGIKLLDEIVQKGVKEVFINPGAESEELLKKVEELGLNWVIACSIRAIGINPEAL